MYLIIALLLLFAYWVTLPPDALHNRPLRVPRRARFGAFIHVKARFFQNYWAMIDRAAKRRPGKRRVDIDHQRSRNGTGWGFHWATIGRNKYHDRLHVWSKNTRIDHLTDAQIEDRLRGPHGERPHRMSALLDHAYDKGVEVEVELKDTPNESWIVRLLARTKTKAMNDKGHLVFKTLAFMGAPHGAANRLRPVHEAGGKTMLSFTDFGRRKALSKKEYWPITDYVRGRAKWAA